MIPLRDPPIQSLAMRHIKSYRMGVDTWKPMLLAFDSKNPFLPNGGEISFFCAHEVRNPASPASLFRRFVLYYFRTLLFCSLFSCFQFTLGEVQGRFRSRSCM